MVENCHPSQFHHHELEVDISTPKYTLIMHDVELERMTILDMALNYFTLTVINILKLKKSMNFSFVSHFKLDSTFRLL